MTLSEILDMMDMLCPSLTTFSDAQKVTVLNEELKSIFRELQENEIYEFDTVADQAIYTKPSSAKLEDFLYVSITTDTTITENTKFSEYQFAELNDELTYKHYYDAFDAGFGVYPVPTTSGWKGRIIYKKRPTLLDSTNQTASPELEEDWHRILVYGAIAELAGAGNNPDIEIANNYSMKYNALLKEIKQSRYERLPKYAATKDVMKRSNLQGRKTMDEVLIYVPTST